MAAELRTDLNGLKVRFPFDAGVYMIDLGIRRLIPSRAVYDELFSTWENIIADIDIDEIQSGDSIPETAFLFRCIDSPNVYLLDGVEPNQVKRHIVSPDVMDRYEFSWARVHRFNVRVRDLKYPDGAPIKNP